MARITITIEDSEDLLSMNVQCRADDLPDDDSEPTRAMILCQMIQKFVLEDFVEATEGAVAHRGVGRIPPVGSRVGAVRNVDDETIYLYGFGVYEGDFPIGEDDSPQPKGSAAELLENKDQTNPRIRLDNGQVVWGCECWMGTEEVIKRNMEGKRVVRVNISQDRAKLAR